MSEKPPVVSKETPPNAVPQYDDDSSVDEPPLQTQVESPAAAPVTAKLPTEVKPPEKKDTRKAATEPPKAADAAKQAEASSKLADPPKPTTADPPKKAEPSKTEAPTKIAEPSSKDVITAHKETVQPTPILRAPRIATVQADNRKKVQGWYTGKPNTNAKVVPKPPAPETIPKPSVPETAPKLPTVTKPPAPEITTKPLAGKPQTSPTIPKSLSASPGRERLRASKTVLQQPVNKRKQAPTATIELPPPKKARTKTTPKRTKPAAAPPVKKTQPNPAVATTRRAAPASQSRKAPSAPTSGKKLASKMVFSGPADDIGMTGWTKKTFERQSGKSKGTRDSYWYSPEHQYKFRSLNEITRFKACLEQMGNEADAWKRFKGKL